ncbi:PAS domain S-box protein, partial [Dolichospermum sp. ST_sed5]|nr:PAS domain S-box protein [Dolichospermum sp. ST_sed5]
LRLDEILQKTVQEVQQFLTADRVIVYQFHPDMSGEIVAESVLPEWTPALNCQIEDTCFRENQGIAYSNGKILAIPNIYHAGLTDCHIQLLEKFQVKANLVVPILLNQKINDQQNSSQQLWGLLISHQCNRTREWQETEIDLLQQLSVQIAVAIKTAELYENLQSLNASLEAKVEERTQQLEASDRRSRAIFNKSFQLTALLNTEGILLEINQPALNFGDLKLEDVINKPFWEIYCWKISSATQEQLKQAIARAAQGEFIRYEVDVLSVENKIATIDFSIRPLKDQFGKVILLISEGRDITECKQAETTLQLQAQILNDIHDAVISTDINGLIQTWNYTAQRIYGYTATEVIGKNISLLYFPEELAQIQQLVFQPLLKHGSSEIELPNRTKSGKKIYISLRLSVMRDEEGNIIRLIGCSNDISKRKQAELNLRKLNGELESRVDRRTAELEQINHELVIEIKARIQAEITLRESEQKFRQIAENIDQAFWISDAEISQTIYISPAYEKIWGVSCESLYENPKSFIDAIHPDDLEQFIMALQNNKNGFDIECRIMRPDGSIRWINDRAFPLKDETGEVYRVVGIAEDITQRKQFEEEISKALEREKELSELKSCFVSMTSHEFRTPLTVISSSAEILKNFGHKLDEESKKKHLECIQTYVKHTTQLLDDILLINKAETGNLAFESAPLDLVSFCQKLTAEIQLSTSNHIIVFASNSQNNVIGNFDKKILRQILINLLSNAIKYSPNSAIVNFNLDTTESNVIFSIQDQGIGIPEADQVKLFESFHRAKNVGNIPGTGLGLSIVAKCVDLHKGAIAVNSQIGMGTTFIVTIPLNIE